MWHVCLILCRDDYLTVMDAVSQDGLALKFATERLRGDREIVMRAVSRNGFAFQFAMVLAQGWPKRHESVETILDAFTD